VALGLGHSFGGTSLLGASAAHPGLFERLVLVDPVMPAHLPQSRAARRAGSLGLAEAARRRRAVWPSREAARARWAGKELFAAWDPRALDLYLAEGLRDRPDGQVELKCPPEIEATIFEQGYRVDVWSRVGENPAPTRILWARRGSFPRVVFEELARRMPVAEVRDADCGHLVPMEDPQLVVREVLDFLGIDGAGGQAT
jgi:pimeloyl-ACP methyl ester carboxylesterase